MKTQLFLLAVLIMAAACSKNDSIDEIEKETDKTENPKDTEEPDNSLELALAEQRVWLKDFYNSTDGDNWNNRRKTNNRIAPENVWKVDDSKSDISKWEGITVDSEGWVIKIELPYGGLLGVIPESIGKLTKLTELHFYGNALKGPLPSSLDKLIELKLLNIAENEFTGEIPAVVGKLKKLTLLVLSGNKLTGTIPIFLGSLTELKGLNLSKNQLTGNIPEALTNLTKLELLGLHNNKLSGTIPSFIGNFTELLFLELHENQFTGTIPASLSKLVKLEYMNLSKNQLTGNIPVDFQKLTKIKQLVINENRLSGKIPTEVVTKIASQNTSGWTWKNWVDNGYLNPQYDAKGVNKGDYLTW